MLAFNNISICLKNCKYFTANELINLSSNLKQKSTVSTLAVNYRSLRIFFYKLELCLKTTHIPFDVIGITETWLADHDNTDLFTLNGYTRITYPRIKGKGGSVGIYISNKY